MNTKRFAKIWLLALSLGLPIGAWADSQARLNVVARALDAYTDSSVKTIAITGFSNLEDGRRPPICQKLEEGLRSAFQNKGIKHKVLDPGKNPQDADAVVSGTYSPQDGQVRVHVVMSDESGTALMTRDCVLDASEYQGGDFSLTGAASTQSAAATAPQPPTQVVPSVPEAEVYPYRYYSPYYYPRRFWGPYHLDFSVGYKAFFPLNSSLQSLAGSQYNGFKMGLNFDDVFLMDYDYWYQGVSNQGTFNGLEYTGTQFALVYPWHLGPHFTLYLGPGGRFGQIRVNDTSIPADGVYFGNNGFVAVAGAKAMMDYIGLDLRYTYDLAYTYTGYHTLSLGAFYEFGR